MLALPKNGKRLVAFPVSAGRVPSPLKPSRRKGVMQFMDKIIDLIVWVLKVAYVILSIVEDINKSRQSNQD